MKFQVQDRQVLTVVCFALTWSLHAAPALPVINTTNIVVVTNAPYHAVGDGLTTNTTAIQNAINAAALGGTTNGAAGGTVEIPPGIYLSGPLTLANSINLQIDAGAILRMLPLGMYPGGTTTGTTFISGSNLHDLELSGSGAIDGQGAAWWPYASTNGAYRPMMFSPAGCNRVLIQNVTLSNSPSFHIAISGPSFRQHHGARRHHPGARRFAKHRRLRCGGNEHPGGKLQHQRGR